ncbi:MAG: translesion error-prone DNA polymerase V autoproteolytic subunit [Bacteroidota bacterium]|nr:translesion error-prone DNA polymerase V autoproteolytic subunit [Bacteroidota bacterium]
MKNNLEFFSADNSTDIPLPFVEGIKAGFPSPAADYSDISIDLNRELIKHPSSTFYARVRGESMRDAGINDGDLLVIDKSLEPTDGRIAVCYIDGEFTLKRIRIEGDGIYLYPANSEFSPIHVTEENEFVIWGILTHSIKSY